MSVISICNGVVSGPEEVQIPAHLSYGQFLFDQLKKGNDRVALICAETGQSVTYRSILQTSVNLAVALQELGLKKGEVVALSSENRFEFIYVTLAVVFCGSTLSTLNVTYSPGEIMDLLLITKPKFIFTSPIIAQNIHDCFKLLPFTEKLIIFGKNDVVPGLMYEDLVKKKTVDVANFTLVDVNGVEDSVAVMCSSGTTGLPKGVLLTHVNFLTVTHHMKYYLTTTQNIRQHKVSTYLSLVPWFHAYGFITTFAVLSMHIENVFLNQFDEHQYLETIQKYKVNMTTIVPSLALFFAKSSLVSMYDLSSLKEIWCGAAPLASHIQSAASKRIGIDYIRQGYGLTELTMACCVDLMSGGKPGSCGTPAPRMKIKVLNVETGKKLGPGERGELWIKSPLRMKGYMGDQASGDVLLDADGYMCTGDIGYYDEEGYFYIVDRLKELIKYKAFQSSEQTHNRHNAYSDQESEHRDEASEHEITLKALLDEALLFSKNSE